MHSTTGLSRDRDLSRERINLITQRLHLNQRGQLFFTSSRRPGVSAGFSSEAAQLGDDTGWLVGDGCDHAKP